MYTYNKTHKSYTSSSDELDIDSMLASTDNNDTNNSENQEENLNDSNDYESTEHKKPKKIEVINGGNDLDISPVSNYIEVEKPKNEKKGNIVIPEDNK